MIWLKLGVLYFLYLSTSTAEDKKWVWSDNSRNSNGRSGGVRYESRDPRYNVYENGNENEYGSIGPSDFNNRPPYSGTGFNRPPPFGPGIINNRPLPGGPGLINNRPIYPNPAFLGNNRPGGIYGNNGPIGGGYGQGSRPFGRPEYYPNDPRDPGILTGPIPSWVQEKPFKNFDTCKCTEKFNCRSPGLSYGQCDVGKKYCCYNRNKIEDLGSDFPSRPVHSPENGILVGPGGPVGASPGFGRPSFIGIRPSGYGIDNGILSGPNGRLSDRRRSN